MIPSVRVTVPATVANLGSGFDCLGLAVDLHNEVFVSVEPEPGVRVDVVGEGRAELAEDASNLVASSLLQAYAAAGQTAPGLSIRCANRIPLSRGLGSSSAAIVGGLVAGNALMGRPLSEDALLQLAARLEGHPDNVAPALIGGVVLVVSDGGNARATRVDAPHLSRLRCVLTVPDLRVSTEAARQALPELVPLADAVFNAGRAALWVHALTSGDLTLLGQATEDRLHQPYRAHLIKGVDRVFAAARQTGALGVCVSGSGPTVCALAADDALGIAQAMCEAFAALGVDAAAHILSITSRGAWVADE